MTEPSNPPVETRIGQHGDSYSKVLDLEAWDLARLTEMAKLVQHNPSASCVWYALGSHDITDKLRHTLASHIQGFLTDPELVLSIRAADGMADALRSVPDLCEHQPCSNPCDLIGGPNGYCPDHEHMGADPTPLTREEVTTPDAVYGITNEEHHP